MTAALSKPARECGNVVLQDEDSVSLGCTAPTRQDRHLRGQPRAPLSSYGRVMELFLAVASQPIKLVPKAGVPAPVNVQ